MIELTAEDLPDYLRHHGWVESANPIVTSLSGGVSNVVYRVQDGERLFVLKQSRSQLRTREAWFSDLNRIWREQEVMQVLHGMLGDVVPRVLQVDRENYVFTMSHAPIKARTWKELLLTGNCSVAVAQGAGKILGEIHAGTKNNPGLVARFRDRRVFDQLRIDPFYRRIQQRHPELAPFIQPLIERMLSSDEALCHGDFSPKNLLVDDSSMTLVDYETAHQGDPSMDLGFFFSHLILKAAYHAPNHQPYLELVSAAWSTYRNHLGAASADLMIRGVKHLGVCLLARIDGTSPVDYLPQESRREAIREVARALLRDKRQGWDDALSRVDAELSARCQ